MNEKKVRLQVLLAKLGLGSRRGVIRLIAGGAVQVNGQVTLEKGLRIDPQKDYIEINGKKIDCAVLYKKYYYIFHKPVGVTTTLSDIHADKSVADYLKNIGHRLFPVGRLDKNSSGLLLLTNDGELAFRLLHPKFGIQKKYLVTLNEMPAPEIIKKIQQGVQLEKNERTAPVEVEVILEKKGCCQMFLTLREGKKREIRRIFKKFGYQVSQLKRIQFGPLKLGNLAAGRFRELTTSEISELKRSVSLK